MILKKFLNFWKPEPHDSFKKNSYIKERVQFIIQNNISDFD